MTKLDRYREFLRRKAVVTPDRGFVIGLGCSVSDCPAPVHSKRMCKTHYQRQWRTGSSETKKRCFRLPMAEKYAQYVIQNDDPDACWDWSGFKDKDGYGKMRVGKQNRAAHCISWEIHFGTIPAGMLVRHVCNNEPCSNPRHLRLGDQFANMADRQAAGNYARGDRHSRAKISDAVVAEIRASKRTYKHLSAQYGISVSQVGNISRGEQRKAVATELNHRYFLDGCAYAKAMEDKMAMPTLFDTLEADEEMAVSA